MPRIDARQQEVLNAVVRLNVETGRPVSSALVSRSVERRYSAATVRNVMKGLEELGLLMQPHTSAGRLPTDAGFRAFVDRLLGEWPLRGWVPPRLLRQQVERGLSECAGSHDLIRSLAVLLSQLTANISIILGPGWDGVRAQRIDLYPKESGRILLVLVLENALVRTALLRVPEPYPPVVLEAAGAILSERVAGRTVGEIRRVVLRSLEVATGPAAGCARELARQGSALFDSLEEADVQLEGVANVLDQPEFSEPGVLQALVRFIESPQVIRDALNSLDRHSDEEIGVWIGDENPVDELRPFGLVLHGCRLEGRRGLMAVLGPRRMLYQRAFTGLDFLQRSLQVLS